MGFNMGEEEVYRNLPFRLENSRLDWDLDKEAT